MVQYSSNFEQLTDLDPVLTEIFFQAFGQISPILRPLIYNPIQSSKEKENFVRVGSFGDPVDFDTAGQVNYRRADADYEINLTPGHYTNGFSVPFTMLEDMQYPTIFQSAQNLAQSFARKMLKDEATVFENAFSTSTPNLGYDSKALVSASHPRSKSDSTSVSNLVTGSPALTADNLETAIVQLEGLGDDIGEETSAMATHLVVGRSNRKKGLELTGSELTPESANNATNVHGDLVTVVHPYITGNKWFVIDALIARQHLHWIDRLPPQFYSEDDGSSTLVRKFVGRGRWTRGWTDFRWVVGSNAS